MRRGETSQCELSGHTNGAGQKRTAPTTTPAATALYARCRLGNGSSLPVDVSLPCWLVGRPCEVQGYNAVETFPTYYLPPLNVCPLRARI